jgi:hypothetical protein
MYDVPRLARTLAGIAGIDGTLKLEWNPSSPDMPGQSGSPAWLRVSDPTSQTGRPMAILYEFEHDVHTLLQVINLNRPSSRGRFTVLVRRIGTSDTFRVIGTM